MGLRLRRFARATNEAEIAGFERARGVSLPAGYRSFLLQTNGGRCLDGGGIRDPQTGDVITEVDLFLGFSDKPHQDLIDVYLALSDCLPAQILPVASDAGGNHLLLDCDLAGPYGALYFIGSEFLGESAQRRDLLQVHASFQGLLDAWGGYEFLPA